MIKIVTYFWKCFPNMPFQERNGTPIAFKVQLTNWKKKQILFYVKKI